VPELSEDIPRVALVTGAAKRVGRALALALARDGWAVAVHYATSRAEAEQTAAEIEAAGGRAVTLQAELTDEGACAALVEHAASALGPVGLLVNNAAVFEYDTAATATRASWDRHMEINLRAPFVLAQRLQRQLPKGRQGMIVNLLDGYVLQPAAGFASYHLSKVGLYSLTQSLALQFAPNVRVNAIGPGALLPDHYRDAVAIEAAHAETPLKRGTDPDEIYRTLRFFLDAPSVTGQMVALDGGRHLGGSRQGDEL
jgi:NAD(P)-dependent dehydrogenase (short-subunit alcohol dehydrogenase family)